jgi:hypothetical protein
VLVFRDKAKTVVEHLAAAGDSAAVLKSQVLHSLAGSWAHTAAAVDRWVAPHL